MLFRYDIGITLGKYRNVHSYSQQYVATYLGISRVAYRKWENNQINFSISQMIKIASLYTIKPEELIKFSFVS